jgi:hypothetical protein
VGVRIIRKLLGLIESRFVCENEYGGLGVRRMGEFNIALLGKLCWRM